MFGSNDQNDQQQTHQAANDFGAPAQPQDQVADSSLGNNNGNQSPVDPNNGSLMQDISAPTTALDTSAPSSSSISIGNADALLNIKQSALQDLSPLVDHIDQTPEEKFRTTMMMIQATDDQTLVKTAYEAAQKITDDKARAQALLDVINEINYFTQQHSN